MRRKIECCECEKALKKDEVALCKKLLGTDTEDYYCIEEEPICWKIKYAMFFPTWWC